MSEAYGPGGADETWRPTWLGQVGYLLMGAMLLALGVFWCIDGVIGSGGLVGGLVFGVLSLLAGLWFVLMSRARIVLTAAGVEVRNLVRTSVAPWETIRSASSGWWGITLGLDHGRTVLALAVQKTNVARWAVRRTRADVLTERIMARVAAARPGWFPEPTGP